jgi:cytochrome b involved in lipid metabolism
MAAEGSFSRIADRTLYWAAPMTRLQALMEDAARVQRQNHGHVQRLVGLLDLEPPLDPGAVAAVVDAELAAERDAAVAALASLSDEAAAAARSALLTGNDFPGERLASLAAGAPAATAAVLAAIVERQERLWRRLGWLLRPSTFAEVQRLDPRRDCDQIYHFVSYEFRFEQKLFAFLFELAPLMIPYSSLLIASTGELSLRAWKRFNDTFMFFSNLIEWGLDSRRGREALARLAGIHGRYSLPNELFRFILGGVMFIPLAWNERLGWRPFTEVERLGWFHTFLALGRAMNIEGLSDDFEETRAWWWGLVDRAGETSTVGQAVFHDATVQVLATYPAPLRRPLLAALLGGMPAPMREVLDLPPAPPEVLASARTLLHAAGAAASALPRVPWIRSLQVHPLYRRVADIGVHERSPLMPRLDAAAPNGGHPTGQRPIPSPAQLPETTLPVWSLEEVAAHARDGDAWIAVDGAVYDVSRFLQHHPGGRDALAPHLGRDASAAFRAIGHSDGARIMMANFRVGRLAGGAPAPAAVASARIHSGRRAGRDRVHAPGAWDATLDAFEQAIARYEAGQV